MKGSLVLFLAIVLFGRLEANSPLESSITWIFSASQQLILPGEAVLFEKTAVQFCESGSGTISFNRSGTYKFVWYGQARPIYRRPWILGFSLDNVILVGNIYGNSDRHLHPEKFEGSLVLSINAGQVLRFVNASSNPIEFIPSESNPAHPSFTLKVSLFELTYPDPFYIW